ncbi:twin-arginine translocase TatA/TatE family subunit [Cohnella soli]|uniref:Twin-arginine translocase TatA/TatE family subunit n=1 Tax=Cohnella soli TaxID=425005 RepID=A0ABW0HZK9_9BACL
MPHFSSSTIILLIIAALLLFGPNRLPELGRAIGKTFREFKNGTKELIEDPPSDPLSQQRKEVRTEESKNLELTSPPLSESKP